MLVSLFRRQDFWAGALLAVLGAGVVVEGSSYEIGSLSQLGPGFIPVVLGVVLVGLGLLIVRQAFGPAVPTPAVGHEVDHPFDPRGVGMIVSGVAAFILLGEHLGLAAATFGSVLITCFADRSATVKGSLALSLILTATTIVLFGYLLQLPLPLWPPLPPWTR